MPKLTAPTIIEVEIDRAPGSPLAHITCSDSHSGKTYAFSVPWYALRALRDSIDQTIAKHEGLFPATQTTCLD